MPEMPNAINGPLVSDDRQPPEPAQLPTHPGGVSHPESVKPSNASNTGEDATAPRPRHASVSFTRGFLWLAGGNAIYGACQWVVILLIARLGTQTMVGQFSLAQALVLPIVVFFSLQLRVVQVTDQGHRYTFGDYLLVRLLTAGAGLATILVTALTLGYAPSMVAAIAIVAIARTSEIVSDIFLGAYQQREAMKPIGLSATLRGTLSTVLLAAMLIATKSLMWAVAGLAVGCIAMFLLSDIQAPTRLGMSVAEKHRSFSNAPKLIRLSLPLGIVTVLMSLNTNVPRYFVHAGQGDAALGQFAALSSVQALGLLFVNALGQVITPQLAQCYAANNLRRFRRLVLTVLGIVAAACALGLAIISLAGDRLVSFLFGSAYAGQNGTLLCLAGAASMVLCSSVLACAASAARKLKHQAISMLVVTSATALGCWLLVPAYGGFGAAMSTLGSSIISFCLFATICRNDLFGTSQARQFYPAN